jgi:hypothetical protein
MTLADVLIDVRKQLIEPKSGEQGEMLFVALSQLLETCYERGTETQCAIIVDLLDTARDVAMGVVGKSQIPSENDIQVAFVPSSKAS